MDKKLGEVTIDGQRYAEYECGENFDCRSECAFYASYCPRNKNGITCMSNNRKDGESSYYVKLNENE